MKKNQGLTLIELLVVILIIAMLATFGVVSYKEARAKGRDTKRVYDAAQYVKAMVLYAQENSGSYPTASGFLGRGGAIDSEIAKYLPTPPKDPSDTGGVTVGSSYYYYLASNNCEGDNLPTIHVQNIETSNASYHQNPCTLGASGSENGFASQADYLLIVR
ncbi:MAG: type II secretion system protein [Patescibacteria group bacterium]|nr:type II secretion system protein [Patescibacteria group bacterium]